MGGAPSQDRASLHDPRGRSVHRKIPPGLLEPCLPLVGRLFSRWHAVFAVKIRQLQSGKEPGSSN